MQTPGVPPGYGTLTRSLEEVGPGEVQRRLANWNPETGER